MSIPKTIIEIRPFKGGWQCYEGPGVGPFWTGDSAKKSAGDYLDRAFLRTKVANDNHTAKRPANALKGPNGNEAVEAVVQIGSRFAGADPDGLTELNLSTRAYE